MDTSREPVSKIKMISRRARYTSSMLAMALVFIVGMAFSTGVSHAQNTNVVSMKVQPALFEQTVNPGDRFSTSITVTNPDAVTRQFTVGVEDISGINQAGEPIFTSSSVPQYGLSSWVTLGQSAVSVPAGGSV